MLWVAAELRRTASDSRVARSVATIERGHAHLGQRGTGLQALDQVGVGDEVVAESDEIVLARPQAGIHQIMGVAVVGQVGLLKAAVGRIGAERCRITRATGRAFDDMQVDDA